MNDAELEQLRFPIGRFAPPHEPLSQAEFDAAVDEIQALPGKLRTAVEPLTSEQLNTRYRPEGWTLRQVVHHLADSYSNSYVRFKWALTEDEPLIKAYFEERWAEMEDYALPVGPSLDQLDALLGRWIALLRSMSSEDRLRGFIHPESGERIQLDVNAALYAWHGRHHLAHIVDTVKAHGWTHQAGDTTAHRLRVAVRTAEPRLRALTEEASQERPREGAWSPRELIGHLIDSASNNHQRFVRSAFVDHLDFPGYEQDDWVSVQNYQDAPWHELLDLWRSFNLQLARVIEAIPEEARELQRSQHALDQIAFKTLPKECSVTLASFMADYVDHLEYHLKATV